MSDEFIYPHDRIRMVKANDAETRQRAIRIYKSSPDGWTLQLRSPIGLGTFGLRDGKDFIVASASCSLDDLRAIRDAIDTRIQEAEARGCCGEHETGSGQHGDECATEAKSGRRIPRVNIEHVGGYDPYDPSTHHDPTLDGDKS